MSKFTLTLDSSQIYTFMTCPLQWHYQYNENLALDTQQSPAPDKGTLIHNLLDMYYTFRWQDPNGDKLAQANAVVEFFKSSQTTKTLFPQDKGDLEMFLCNRFLLYVARYIHTDFNLPTTKTSPCELGFSHLLYEDEELKFILEGRIDLINLVNTGSNYEYCFTDHKTQARSEDLYKFKPQFKTYALVTCFRYGMVNYFGMQQKFEEGKTFRRDFITFPAWMIAEWREKLLLTFHRLAGILMSGTEVESRMYDLKNDSACGGAYEKHPCQFCNICEEGNWNTKQQIKSFKYIKTAPWRPW